MRDPLRVDEAYYISHQTDYSKFADAVMDVGACPMHLPQLFED